MRQSLRNQDETSLVAALTALRNQFTIKYDEANISANDERLLLAKDWLESEPGAQDLFEIWGKTSTPFRGAKKREQSWILFHGILNLFLSYYTCDAGTKPMKPLIYLPDPILRLYDRNQPEGTNEEEIPADVAHHFLLAVCSHPGSGICFRDRGWYPREDVDNNTQGEVQEPSAHKPGSRIYNKILGNVIKGLKVNEDSRQQELALRILTACPELVAGYWPAAALTLEPRLSSRWISNVAFFGQVISLPVPRSTFLIPGSDLYHPSPPPLSTILENILPSVSIKIHLSRGLQSTSTLVQHCAALALAKCLMKYGDVVKALRAAEEALEEDEEEGQWVRRRKEVEREVARRVPEFQVIVGFAQQKANEMRLVSDAEANHTHVNATKAALLSECALRLMWLYHRWLPASVAEARFDVGKLLQGIQDGISPAGTMQALNASSGLVTLRQLHILRLLKESDQFSWTGKTGSSRGHLSVLLKLYISTELGAARSTISALLRHTLSSTINFQHDADEVDLWLRSLPSIKRASDAEAPDGTPLTSEEEAVISCLDDCAQRCMKTPYRYVEGLQALWSPHKSHAEAEAGDSHPIIDRPDLFPSPMLITILEQMEARFNGNLLPPSDALAIVTYIRKLTLNLAGKVWSLGILHAIAKRIKDMTNSITLRPVITAAIHKESTILSTSIQQLEHPSLSLAPAMNLAIEEFLAHVQQVAVPVAVHDRQIAASELVDWIRLAAQPMNSSQFMQLISAVERFHRPSLGQVFQFLLPVEGHLWTAARQMSIADLHLGLDFSLLFFHSDDDTLADEKTKRILVESIFICDPTVVAVTHAVRLIDHRLVSSEQNESRRRDLLLLLAMVMSRLKSSDISDRKAVQQFVFQLGCFRECTREPLSGPILQAFQDVIREILDPTDIAQKRLLSEFANPWALMLGGDLDSLTAVQVATAAIWLRYMSTEALNVLLDHFCETVQRSRRFAIVFENLLTAINQTLGEMDMATLGTRLPSLLRLQATSPNLLPLEELLAATIGDLLPAFYDGQFSQNPYSGKGCAAVVAILEERWACRHIKLESVDIQPFLKREIWSPSAKTIVLSLIYLQSSARVAALQWIRSGAPVAHPAKHIALVTHALLGASASSPFVDQDSNIIVLILQNLLREITEDTPSSDLTALCVECISLLVIKCPPSVLQALLSATEEHYKAAGFSMQFIALARCFNSSSTLESSDFVRRVIAGGLRWVMEFLSEGQQLAGRVSQTVVELTSLLRVSSEIKPHLVEPVMTAVLQSYLGDGVILRFIDELLLHVNLKTSGHIPALRNDEESLHRVASYSLVPIAWHTLQLRARFVAKLGLWANGTLVPTISSMA
ncbi:hypothetical protein PHLCEN_2v11530 [Hermanssonia centrifuga]|uniref:Uncharacterized protein n=1 Tax=Hermanssonia centrifuga TaxID=98765 RepID=A0A2R6NJT4_9APHY|nr:hypothetical protein PHLCEN_2v11530 [Hermanssonia centrifuga]